MAGPPDERSCTASTDSLEWWAALSECPASSLRWGSIGYRCGYNDGAAAVLIKLGEAGDDVRSDGTTQHLRRPSLDELTGRRRYSNEPCPRGQYGSCSCSRCTRAQAWARRGGRDYLGVEQEAALARGAR